MHFYQAQIGTRCLTLHSATDDRSARRVLARYLRLYREHLPASDSIGPIWVHLYRSPWVDPATGVIPARAWVAVDRCTMHYAGDFIRHTLRV